MRCGKFTAPQVEQHLAALQFLAVQMIRDHLAQEAARRALDRRVVETLLMDGLQGAAGEYHRAVLPSDAHRALFDPVFIKFISVQRLVCGFLEFEVQGVAKQAQQFNLKSA